jgi:hypothetical protein
VLGFNQRRSSCKSGGFNQAHSEQCWARAGVGSAAVSQSLKWFELGFWSAQVWAQVRHSALKHLSPAGAQVYRGRR